MSVKSLVCRKCSVNVFGPGDLPDFIMLHFSTTPQCQGRKEREDQRCDVTGQVQNLLDPDSLLPRAGTQAWRNRGR